MPLIQYLSRILFDFGALSGLGEEIARLGIRRPLLVTDKGIAAAGILTRALDAAKPFAPVLYDATPENPTEAALLDCLELWRDRGCDGVIALGGGSAIDLAKAVALLTSHGGALADYGVKTGGSEGIGKVSPQIAIPTAAGTGAEVGRACVMSLLDGRKSVAVNLNMVADTVICDPELTLSLPPQLTAATGIDALSHGIETTCSPWQNPPAAAIALDCVRRAAKWLPIAVQDGGNRQARWQMMMAALMGGMCLQKALGAAHAMANPLGALGLHHGTLIGVLLPHVLRCNEGHADAAMSELRAAIGLHPSAALHDWARDLVAQLGLPGTLGALGVDAAVLPEMARKASQDRLSQTNPRPLTQADYLALLQGAA
ncbi:Alcohol dehydrogenase [Candidatus Rhodobacter oscarellae]|uniref:Alcohol dehydrogenase n=1 Tax=Candidatus Rhodobacter oscarellae TaxID=1675527 RepID=A0A0J9E5V5_9RHOB|nr:iron-containing alcohol dehydrogenase [Candidatus Rhodobacter lobularis]KMW57189.1 Alcohol dehydrogenase [Candidatus Rhodobacter lobularis]